MESTQDLLQTALAAMNEARDTDALHALDALLATDAENASAHYLMGAQRAQLGDLELAGSHFARAVQLEPGLEMARFQLGQLQLVRGDVEGGTRVLAAFMETPSGALSLFAGALVCLATGREHEGLMLIEQGLTQPQPNDALASDMRALAQRIQHGSEQVDATPGASLYLSNYSRYNA